MEFFVAYHFASLAARWMEDFVHAIKMMAFDCSLAKRSLLYSLQRPKMLYELFANHLIWMNMLWAVNWCHHL